jgi:hypothetical protein
MIMDNYWNSVPSWFKDVSDRKDVVREFNNEAKAAYINGSVPYQLKCGLSRGNKAYKHSTSAWFKSGIRIVVMTNGLLSDDELNRIGLSVLADSKTVRMLITLGWDTLEVICDKGDVGLQWKLTKFSK